MSEEKKVKEAIRFDMLDLIRGLAALEVFLSHLRTLFFSNYHQNTNGLGVSVFYYLTGFSHEAVIVFFVLSGFFISRNVVMAIKGNYWTWGNYLTDRLVRLWIVLIPALIFTAMLDHLGITFFPLTDAYNGVINFIGHNIPREHLELSVFIGNIFFLQGIYVHTFGSNNPLWSLANEFWYYILFPLFYLSIINRKTVWKVVYLLLGIMLCLFIGESVRIYFLIWLIGYCVWILPPWQPADRRMKWVLTLLALIIFVIALNFNRFHKGFGIGKDVLLAISTGSLIYLLIGTNILKGSVKKAASFLSEISYSLYLIHLPLAFLISSWFVYNPVEFSLKYFGYFIVAGIIIFLVTCLFWMLFESRYKQVRTFFKEKLKTSKAELFRQK